MRRGRSGAAAGHIKTKQIVSAAPKAVNPSQFTERGLRLLSPVCVNSRDFPKDSRHAGRNSPLKVINAKPDTSAAITANKIWGLLMITTQASHMPANSANGVKCRHRIHRHCFGEIFVRWSLFAMTVADNPNVADTYELVMAFRK